MFYLVPVWNQEEKLDLLDVELVYSEDIADFFDDGEEFWEVPAHEGRDFLWNFKA